MSISNLFKLTLTMGIIVTLLTKCETDIRTPLEKIEYKQFKSDPSYKNLIEKLAIETIDILDGIGAIANGHFMGSGGYRLSQASGDYEVVNIEKPCSKIANIISTEYHGHIRLTRNEKPAHGNLNAKVLLFKGDTLQSLNSINVYINDSLRTNTTAFNTIPADYIDMLKKDSSLVNIKIAYSFTDNSSKLQDTDYTIVVDAIDRDTSSGSQDNLSLRDIVRNTYLNVPAKCREERGLSFYECVKGSSSHQANHIMMEEVVLCK